MLAIVLHILLLALGYRLPGLQSDPSSPAEGPWAMDCGVRTRARAKGTRAHRNLKLCVNPRHCPTGFG